MLCSILLSWNGSIQLWRTWFSCFNYKENYKQVYDKYIVSSCMVCLSLVKLDFQQFDPFNQYWVEFRPYIELFCVCQKAYHSFHLHPQNSVSWTFSLLLPSKGSGIYKVNFMIEILKNIRHLYGTTEIMTLAYADPCILKISSSLFELQFIAIKIPNKHFFSVSPPTPYIVTEIPNTAHSN